MKTIVWLAILLISLMPLSAQIEGSIDVNTRASAETSGDSSTQTSTETSTETSASTDASVQAETKTRADQRKEQRTDMKEKRQEVRVVVKNILELRKSTRAELKQTREELRSDLKGMKEDLKACKGQESDECSEKRVEAKLAVKSQLLVSAEEALKFLEASKARIAESKLDAKAEITAEIDARIKAVTDAKVKVEALTEASSKEEIRAATKSLRKAIQESKFSLRKSVHLLVAKKLGNVVERSETLVVRLEKTLDRLKAKSVDTSSVDTAAFKAKVDAAAKLHMEAVALFEKARSAQAGEKDELMKKATDKMRERQKTLKEAHGLLKGILQDLKALKGGSEALASVSAEVSASAAAS